MRIARIDIKNPPEGICVIEKTVGALSTLFLPEDAETLNDNL